MRESNSVLERDGRGRRAQARLRLVDGGAARGDQCRYRRDACGACGRRESGRAGGSGAAEPAPRLADAGRVFGSRDGGVAEAERAPPRVQSQARPFLTDGQARRPSPADGTQGVLGRTLRYTPASGNSAGDRRMRTTSVTAALCGLLLTASLAFAQPPGGARRGPPPEPSLMTYELAAAAMAAAEAHAREN